MDCIFCKIIAGDIPCSKVLETHEILAFHDIHPAAPVHVLVVPKKHVDCIQALTEETLSLVAPMHAAIRDVAIRTGIAEEGYRVISNNGESAGQTVMHLHYHVLGGKRLGTKLM